MLNYALPGTIVGIAYLLAFNDKPLALTGTATILIACYVFRYSPTGIRTTVALLQQIDSSMEEASASLGAGSLYTFRRVMLPLILPAFFAGLGVVFIRSMTAISATIFLVSINWTLITVKILENMTEVALGPAAAFSVFVIVVVLCRDRVAQRVAAAPDRAEPARRQDRNLTHGDILARNPARRRLRRFPPRAARRHHGGAAISISRSGRANS